MSNEITIQDKTVLEEYYSRFGSTISSTANHFNTSNPTVRKWLIYYDITRKSHKQASIEANNRKRNTIPSDLELQYSSKSIKDLEKLYGVGQETIYHWMDRLNIPKKDFQYACLEAKERYRNNLKPSKEDLIEVYSNTHNIQVVADHFNVSPSFLRNTMKDYEIDIAKPWRSKAEIDLFNWCEKEFPDLIWNHSNKSIINPFELDIVCETYKLAIEYCGLYWHSETFANKDKKYHQMKYLKCKEKGYQLLTVFETDDIEKVKNNIRYKLSNSIERIGARECRVSEINPTIANEFHNKWHMHNTCGSKVHLGLFYKDKLVQVCSFGKSRFSTKYEYELTRYTNSNVSIMGGFSKLLKQFIRLYNPESIVTFSDLRYGEGKTYNKTGFSYIGMTEPNYWYFHKYNTRDLYSRVKFQKHKLNDLLDTFDNSITEYQNMVNNGYGRIWDCGNMKYELINTHVGN